MKKPILLVLLAVVALLAAACGSDDGAESTTTTAVATTTTAGVGPTTSTVPGATTTTKPSTSTSAPSTTRPPTTGSVTVWFGAGDGTDCSEVAGFPRTVDSGSTIAIIEATLAELLLGPTDAEQLEGAGSFFAADLDLGIHGVTLVRGLLVVDFQDLRSLIPNASTSCGSESLLAQLNATSLQFEAVDRVRYEIDGSCDAFSNWLQRECEEYTVDGAVPATLTTIERASGSGCSPGEGALPDGRWFGYVTAADSVAVTFDLACWFDGTAAADAAAEDGEESPPPNDYYVRNASAVERVVPADPAAAVNWMPQPADPASAADVPYGDWVAQRDTRPFQPGVWLTIAGGAIDGIVEQYVP